MAVIPVAKALYLCEETDTEGGSTNLYALLASLRASTYPHTQPSFTSFAQLRGGLGIVRCHFDVRRADDALLIHTTHRIELAFPNRSSLVQLAAHIERCVFPTAGIYLVELFCDNVWVADTTLVLREVQP